MLLRNRATSTGKTKDLDHRPLVSYLWRLAANQRTRLKSPASWVANLNPPFSLRARNFGSNILSLPDETTQSQFSPSSSIHATLMNIHLDTHTFPCQHPSLSTSNLWLSELTVHSLILVGSHFTEIAGKSVTRTSA